MNKTAVAQTCYVT